jgi:tetratricopeptide (TPR) repeat protein
VANETPRYAGSTFNGDGADDESALASDEVECYRYRPMPGEPLSIRTDDLRLQRDVWCRLSTYELDLKVRYLVGQGNVSAVREASAQIENILQRHPSYAPAYVTLAECCRVEAVLDLAPPSEAVSKMRRACRRALALDVESTEAHLAFAGVLAAEWNLPAAEAQYKLAIASGARDAKAHQRYAVHLAALGRFVEAVDCADRACDFAPHSPGGEYTRGVVQYWMRDYRRALESADRAVEISAQFGMAHQLRGLAQLQLHEYGRAVEALARATSISGGSTSDRGCEAYGLGRAGEIAAARAILAELTASAEREHVGPLSIALCHLGLGELEAALSWIERAYAPGSCQSPYLLADPLYESLAGLDAFQRVLRRVGLPVPELA